MSRIRSRSVATLPRRALITAALAAPALWRMSAHAQPREKVELLIDWKPSPTYAGFFLAQQTGAFERRGLDVEIVIGHGASASADQIGRGDSAWIGSSSGAATAIARSRGAAIRSLAVYYRETPTVIYSLAGSGTGGGILRPQDLLGRRIGLVPGSITVEEYRALLSANRLDRARITEVEVGWDASALLDGKVDALIDYKEITPAELIAQGRKLDILRLADFGVDCYSLNLIVNAAAWADPKRRPVAKRIAEALAEAYEVVRARPAAASASFMVFFPALSRPYVELGIADVARELGAPPMGGQTRDGWQKTLATLGGLGLLQRPVTVDEVAIFAS
ncbi:MAG: ABC transporter substrate-binding protein [Reyranella sp.]|nr:ABC transporter substrate-binding protein [Reyranella sp.]